LLGIIKLIAERSGALDDPRRSLARHLKSRREKMNVAARSSAAM
jgi:hypothetical protein